MAIDVGADAIDREYAVGNTTRNSCFIEGSNPASSSGQVKKVYIYVKANIGTVYVGIFTHEGGDVFSSRDHQNVGTLDDGLNEKDVDLAVEVGDFIGLRLPQWVLGME